MNEEIIELKSYTVTFIDEISKEVIKKQLVQPGESAIPPEPLEHDGYKFSKWDREFTNVNEDIVVTALYKRKKLLILWLFFGILLLLGLVLFIYFGIKNNWFDFGNLIGDKNKDLFVIEGDGNQWELGQNLQIFDNAQNDNKYIDLYYNINVDTNNDGKCDINCDVDGDFIPDYNIDWKGDLKPHFNVDTDGDEKADQNLKSQLDSNGKCIKNCDTDGNGWPNTNVDIDNNNLEILKLLLEKMFV